MADTLCAPAVPPAAETDGSRECLLERREVADANTRHALDLEPDEHAVERHAADERLRAVDRIEHPAVRRAPVVLPVFLAEHHVLRKPRGDQLPQHALGAPVRDGDRRPIGLVLDGHPGLEVRERALAGCPRGSGGEV